MTEREFVEFVIRCIKWTQQEAERQELPYTASPVNRDWRRLGEFGLFEDSQGNIGFAVEWESDGKRGDREVFTVVRRSF